MSRVVAIVADRVLPVAALPNAQLAFAQPGTRYRLASNRLSWAPGGGAARCQWWSCMKINATAAAKLKPSIDFTIAISVSILANRFS